MVSSDRLLLGSGRNLLTRPTGKGILQLGALEGRTGMYEQPPSIIGGGTKPWSTS